MQDVVKNIGMLSKENIEVTNRILDDTKTTTFLCNEILNNLVEQNEQLVSTNTDSLQINESLKKSERHINNINSIFSSIANSFKPKNKTSNRKQKYLKKVESDMSKIKSSTNDKNGKEKNKKTQNNNISRTTKFDPYFNNESDEELKNNDAEVNETLDKISDNVKTLKDISILISNEIDESMLHIDHLKQNVAASEKKTKKLNNKM